MKNGKTIKVGIIGDYDGRPSHIATSESLKHSSEALGTAIEVIWVPTESLISDTTQLAEYQGLWCAPGSPYKSMLGALNGVRYARENDVPFLGTCGGFQHAILEYAKDILQYKEIEDDDFDIYSTNIFLSEMTCSLVGQSRTILIQDNTLLSEIYKETKMVERYNCSFGLNEEFEKALLQKDWMVAAKDEQGEVRALVLDGKKFFVITLFQPQLSSSKENPHILVNSFIRKIVEQM